MTVRTFWHLAETRRRPSDYEVASTRLLYHLERGIGLRTPVADWHRRHRSKLVCTDWDAFVDPERLTYASYVSRRRDADAFVEGLFTSARVHDRIASDAWPALAEILALVRLPLHALQMTAAYLGALAPGSRIAIACALQAGDELRRVQLVSRWALADGGDAATMGARVRTRWQTNARWQPLRASIERLLATRDFDEALIALQLGLKPAIDHVLIPRIADHARSVGANALAAALDSLGEDARWHAAWSAALLELLAGHPENLTVIAARREAWQAEASSAIAPLAAEVRS